MQYYIANAQHSCRPQRKSVAATKSGREWSFPIEVVSECTAQLGSDDEWRVMGDVCLTFLGTSAGGPPSKHRSFSSVALRTANGDLLLFDCGEGTQRQLIFGSTLRLGKLSAIFITHLHGDHVYGLVPLMSTLSWSLGPDGVLEIFGPVGIRRYVRENIRLTAVDLPYSYRVTELHETTDDRAAHPHLACRLDADLAPGEAIGRDLVARPDPAHNTAYWDLPVPAPGIQIKAAPLTHRIQSVGYVVTENAWPGRLDVDNARALLEPHRDQLGRIEQHFKALKAGQDVCLADGTVVAMAAQCVSAPMRGRRIVVLGDTADSVAMEPISVDADVVVHEATLCEVLRDKAVERGHSTPGMAAAFALKLGAKALILTHISGRYAAGTRPDQSEAADGANQSAAPYSDDEQLLADEATAAGYQGNVLVARDLWSYSVPRPSP